MPRESTLLRRYFEFVIQYRSVVAIAVSTITVMLTLHIGNLKIDNDPDLWAPQSHPYVQATKDLEAVFGGRNITVIGISPKQGDIYQANVLAKLQRIQNGIESLPTAVRHNIISLAARKAKDIRGTADGMQVRAMFDPLPQTPEEIARLKASVAANPIYHNTLVSSDGRLAAVVADFTVDKDNPSYAALYGTIRQIVDRERDDSVDIFLGGLPVQLAWFEFHMMKMPLFFGAALLIILAVQYLSFRSVQGMLLPMATALLSVLWALGLMGLLDVHMDGMNTTTPILIMAIAAGHAIQILKRYYEEYRLLRASAPDRPRAEISRTAVVNSLTRVGPAMLTAGGIAGLSFFTLALVDIAVVQHFGIFAGCGVLGALALEMTLIPALRSWLPVPTRYEVERDDKTSVLDHALSALADLLLGRRAPIILVASFGFVMLALAGVNRLHADNSVKRYNDARSEVRVHDAVLNERLAGTNSIFFLVEGNNPDSIKNPELIGAIAQLQAFLELQPGVGKTQSLADFLRRMNLAMHGDDSRYDVAPTQRDVISQYLFLYSLSGDPQDFDSFVDSDYQRTVLWVYLKDDSTADAEVLYQKARSFVDQHFPAGFRVRVGGSLSQTIAINEVLTHGKLQNMAQMALVVFLLSSIALRSAIGGLFVVTPLLMIVLGNFGVMGWLGAPLDMGTAGTAAMGMGIGADYELYLLFRLREELARGRSIADATRASLLTSGKAVLFVALSVAGGYAVLLASDYAFYTRLATTVIATMLMSAVCALIVLRTMMLLFKPSFVFGASQSRALDLDAATP